MILKTYTMILKTYTMILKTYTIDKQINVAKLDNEISLSNSIIDFKGLCTYDDKIDVIGDSIIDELLLDSIINNHIYTPPIVFKLTNSIDSPIDINYDVFGLHKKRTIVKGELILVEYYKNFNPQLQVYSDLILKEERLFGRDATTGLAYNRIQTISWYLTDNSIGTTKTTTKWYSLTESIDEGLTRRKNIIAEAKIYTLSVLGLQNAQLLMMDLQKEISLFIEGAPIFLKTAISTFPDSKMIESQRTQLINILTM